ncbi:MAG: reverse transcriptase family protein, partial [Bacteroidota bacterium]
MKLSFRFHGQCVSDTVYVCRELKGLLLPWYLMKSMGILSKDYPKPLQINTVIKQTSFEPKSLPSKPTPDEIEKIRKQLLETYSDVFDSESGLKTMDIPPMKIKLKGEVEPYAIRAARPIAYSWRDDVKKEIDWMVERQIIVPVEDDAEEWCHPLVCVPKPNGGVRPCIDLTKLNEHVIRPLYPLKTPKEAVSNISSDTEYLATLDATKGYWQMALDKDSQGLTTFITPWGRYKFLRAPMGLVSTGDEFCRVGDKALEGIDRVQKVVDDMIVYSKGFPEHVSTVVKVLEACRKHKITLNPSKFVFGRSEVNFAGYKVSQAGVTTDEYKLRAIQEFPKPTNLTELRSFIGLVHQASDFSKKISAALEPLRPLLSTKNLFEWNADHDKAFEETKKALVQLHTLTSFDPKLETVLQTDASRKKGLGFVPMQKHGQSWKIVQCGSRFTTPTEARYAMVELELLAIVWAVKKCKIYLEGLSHFKLETDHKPLIPILNKKNLAEVENARVQRLKEKLQNFVFTAEWKKGADNIVSDALSRAPVDQPDEDDVESNERMMKSVRQIMSLKIGEILDETSDSGDPLIEWLQKQAKTDDGYQSLIHAIANDDWGNKSINPYVASFKKLRDDLSIGDGLILFDDRYVV